MELMGGLTSPGARYWHSLPPDVQVYLIRAYADHQIGIDWLLMHCDLNGRRLPKPLPPDPMDINSWHSSTSQAPLQASPVQSEA